MDHSNKIKPLSKKIAASLVKNESSSDFEKSDLFSNKTKEQMLLDITKGERLSLLKSIDTEKDWQSFKRKIQRSGKTSIYWKYAAAASVLLIVASTIFLNKGDDTPQFTEPIIVNNNIEAGIDKATLTLADGSDVTLEKGQVYESNNVTSNGEEIIYNKAAGKEITYNYLTIPRGGQFFIKLSDGTQVWLNSESQIKYPVSFTTGEPRLVELVYGEAYFDVSPSTDHKESAFKVYHNMQEVQVLGTAFNIKAYKDETNIFTTLVEGKIAINGESLNKVLKPGEQATLSREDKSIKINEVDVFREIAWKEGVFSFRHKPLKEIMKVLSRWYDMDVIFENTELESERFMGTLDRNQKIEDILLSIKSTNAINTYEINNKTIRLK